METVKTIVNSVIEDNNLDKSMSEWIEEGAYQMLRIIEETINKNSYKGQAGYDIVNSDVIRKKIQELKYL